MHQHLRLTQKEGGGITNIYLKEEFFQRAFQTPRQLNSICSFRVGLGDVLRDPQAILMCLSFDEHSLVHFSSRYLWDTISHHVYLHSSVISGKGASRYPLSEVHHIIPGYPPLPYPLLCSVILFLRASWWLRW